MTEPARPRRWPGCGRCCSTPTRWSPAVASGRRRGAAAAVAPGRAEVRRPQGRPPPPGHGVRRDPGAHRQPPGRRGGRGTRSTTCSTSRSATGTSRPPPRCYQLRVTKKLDAVVHTRDGAGAGSRSSGATTGTSRGCCPRRPGAGRARASRPRGPAQAEPAGEVPPGRGVPPAAGRAAHRRARQGPPAAAHPRRPAAGGGPRLRQRLPHLRRPPLPHRASGGCPVAVHRGRRQAAVPRPQRRRGGARSASTPTSSSAASPTVELDPPPEVVLALHACDTATDEALARAVEWGAPLVLAAPCCHHDVAAQLRRHPAPAPYAELLRHGILRERFADTLTDALRAALLRSRGLPGRRGRVRRERAHPAQHPAPGGADRGARRPRPRSRVRRRWWRAWSVRPRLAELLGRAPA